MPSVFFQGIGYNQTGGNQTLVIDGAGKDKRINQLEYLLIIL